VIWWTSQPSRARSERLAIAELEERCSWLGSVKWRLAHDFRLCVDFEVEHAGKVVPLTLTYPSFFPEMPPQVTPHGEVRLSGHQYGAGGELCLEYRPDNWEPSFTGAMMIESAHRLLAGEEPSPGEAAEVLSAHRTTVGQEVRSAHFRLILPDQARTALSKVSLGQAVEAEIVEHLAAGHWLAFIRRVADGDLVHWDAAGELPAFRSRKAHFVRLDPALKGYVTATYEFIGMLWKLVDCEAAQSRFASSDEETAIIVEAGGVYKLMSLAPGTGRRAVYDYKTVVVQETKGRRLPAEYGRLAEASVAIVGCGSVGSKVATSLTRAGVGKFVLVDGDILWPDNLVRNDLDWRAVGLNKPDAVEERIRHILPQATVTKRRLVLGGQESSDSTDSALVSIGKCDVIVDATAEPQVFNLCGSVARNEKKALVWGEVFGGGIGGLVARLRPEIDPVPHAARRQILDWCAGHGRSPPQGTEAQYGLALPNGVPPLIADDADVTIMAAHMTRLVLDLLAQNKSLFPHSAYAIGLKPGWIFEVPFDTWPISLVPDGEWGPQKDDNLAEELDAMVRELFPKADATGA